MRLLQLISAGMSSKILCKNRFWMGRAVSLRFLLCLSIQCLVIYFYCPLSIVFFTFSFYLEHLDFIHFNFATFILQLGLQQLKDYPQSFWLALFVEGTRFTQAKLLAAQEYASSNGLHVPRNVLIPRTKGFVTSVSQMRSFVLTIYDMTVAIPRNSTPPTMLRLFKGQPSVVTSLTTRNSHKDTLRLI